MQGTNTSTTVMPVRAYMQAGCEGEGEALLRPELDEANPLNDERRWGPGYESSRGGLYFVHTRRNR